MLELENVHVYYGAIHALKGIAFRVDEGEIVTLIGSNGAGKSTTLNTISGLLRPKEGAMTYLGKDLTAAGAPDIVRMKLSHVPEGRRIFANMTVRENLDLGAYQRRDAQGIKADIAHVFELFPRLWERRAQVAGTLSGGEQQMLAIGRAIMSQPRLLLLDEPSMGLAPILVQQIFDIIRAINREGTTILLVEQNARMALSVADRAYVLETGRIVLSGSAGELMNSPEVSKAYLGGR
ncbi:MAG: ABC transporter ATP-binding protein [Gracilibacteraceae bacterium]|jgi:branched-chain amino acid transport system ATP-binding protein|nr:ABC transporter ATP-binding protein [Gracilibacteraceae bacterium]